jgi:hypothetical protein
MVLVDHRLVDVILVSTFMRRRERFASVGKSREFYCCLVEGQGFTRGCFCPCVVASHPNKSRHDQLGLKNAVIWTAVESYAKKLYPKTYRYTNTHTPTTFLSIIDDVLALWYRTWQVLFHRIAPSHVIGWYYSYRMLARVGVIKINQPTKLHSDDCVCNDKHAVQVPTAVDRSLIHNNHITKYHIHRNYALKFQSRVYQVCYERLPMRTARTHSGRIIPHL